MTSRSLLVASLLSLAGACGSSASPAGPDAHAPDAVAATPDAAPFDNGATTFTSVKHGDPKWQLVDLQMFSAKMGTSQTSDFTDLLGAFWLHHQEDLKNNIVAPKDPHVGPYDHEISDDCAAGQHDPGSRFHVADWTVPQGLYLIGAIVPTADAPTGKSFDSASGPIIPDAVNIVFGYDVKMGDTIVDTTGTMTQTSPTAASINPGTEGWSHIPANFGENTEFVAGAPGSYAYVIHLSESATPANGRDITVPFTIE